MASYESLRKAIQAKNITTIKNFLTILEDVYLIQSLSLFDFSLKKQIYNPDKYYVNDIGFYYAVGFRFSENIGRVLETLVFQQLIRKGKGVSYWKSAKGNEVDFLVSNSKDHKEAIQVTYSLTPENLVRETMGIEAFSGQFEVVHRLILTYDEEKTIEHPGGALRVMPVWKWMIEE